jgi:hypothetical protein
LAVLAVQQIRRMRGGAQGHLMLGADGKLWVVKFQNNPQHVRVLANEMLATRLAAAAGLTVPETAVVEVSEWLIENTPELEVDLGRERVRCAGGPAVWGAVCGRHDAGAGDGLSAGGAVGEIRNLEEFAGMLALDKWTGNANGRQAVFARKARSGGTARASSTRDIAFMPGSGGLRMCRCGGCIRGTWCMRR